MCNSALGGAGCLVLEDGTKQPRPPKMKSRRGSRVIVCGKGMSPIIRNLLEIQGIHGVLVEEVQNQPRELTGTATR